MAFSLRKMLSNITYFKNPGEGENDETTNINQPESHQPSHVAEDSESINFERIEADSTSKQATSVTKHESVKNVAKKASSDTDTLVVVNTDARAKKRKLKKLKLDIKKANMSVEDDVQSSDDVENTPKHILLDSNKAEIFSERMKKFDFSRSFDIFDAMSGDEASSFEEENIDIESLSDTDSDISLVSNVEGKPEVKMCRKVDEPVGTESSNEDNFASASPESFGELEVDKNEEERMSLLLNYQVKLEKMESLLKKLLSEFQFHIEVSKVFNSRSIVTASPGTDINNIPKALGEIAYIDNVSRGVSPTGSWNIVMEKEDSITKSKLKSQLLSMKHCIEEFANIYLKSQEDFSKQKMSKEFRSITFDLDKGSRIAQKHLHISNKKKYKRYDFPDIREAMINLFYPDAAQGNVTVLSEPDHPCFCQCHTHSLSCEADSGQTSKFTDHSMSITSSIGNFSLDSSTLTAYSESLDQVISYNSFQDTSLYSTLLQKAAIERITFYVQVHSIQLKCEPSEQEYESKNVITFHCPSCKITETEENGLLRHILSQSHCEKIHFIYKTAYIKKCVQSGKEIQPSTVLNPMKMYRDENKIVCFGDAMYACSLCFENLIVGESVLMAHCSETEHIHRRDRLCDILE